MPRLHQGTVIRADLAVCAEKRRLPARVPHRIRSRSARHREWATQVLRPAAFAFAWRAARGTELAAPLLGRPVLLDLTREVAMGKVIHAAFGAEREWEQTRSRTADGLVAIGSLFGDDEELMRAKADRVYRLLREIVEDVPSLQITTRLPDNLTEEQLEQ